MNLQSTVSLMHANRKLHKRLKFQGLDISIENRAGTTRKGTSPHWGPWETHMKFDYGYIKGSKGLDGGGVDCFIGPNPKAKMAYVVHIMKLPDFKTFDEDKAMLGWNSKAEAKKAFMAHYDSGKFYGGMSAMPMAVFKRKVLSTAVKGPHKIEADAGEPQVYPGGYAHIEPDMSKTSPPSLRKPYYVPSPSDPREKDDRFLDVSHRHDKATEAFRKRLMKQHPPQDWHALSNLLVQGFPAVTIGGFG